MRWIVRGLTFIAGFLGATALAILLCDCYPTAWMPVSMGVATAFVVRAQGWMRSTGMDYRFVLPMALGTTFTYCLSMKPADSRIGIPLPSLVLALEGITFAICFWRFARIGLARPETAATTAWLIVPVLAGCFLGYVSGSIGGANHMQNWLIRLFHVSPEMAEPIIRWIRKSIHFVAYGTVGYCLLRAAFAGRASRRASLFFALLCTLSLASFDEFRQTTAPNRTGSAFDVALDLSGSAAFCLVGLVFGRNAPRKRSLA
ncbi:MAG: VanZ family protein [Fimbriimonas sp.]|nr:VanZ family protein [Fimbriimonas sp.]